MRLHNYIILSLLLCGGFWACESEWDSHYSEQDIQLDSRLVEVVNSSITEYLKSQTIYSRMVGLFEETEVFERVNHSSVPRFNVFVVPDEAYSDIIEEQKGKKFLAETHISSMAFSPDDLVNGNNLLAWNGKQIPVYKEQVDGTGQIRFYYAVTTKVIKADNGYIYVMDRLLEAPKSLMETILDLDDDYSIFREMILSRNESVFDEENSPIKGVDDAGNTVYDTLTVDRNPYFEAQKLDLFSESSSITMLIPSNQLIENALKDAYDWIDKYEIERPDSIFPNWIMQAAFFSGRQEREVFEDNLDIYSAFGKQWRTTVNTVDLENRMELSNGYAYFVKDLKIPQNVRIYRIKEKVDYFHVMTGPDKAYYYQIEGATLPGESNVYVESPDPWTPGEGWPVINNKCLRMNRVDTSQPTDVKLTFRAYYQRYDEAENRANPKEFFLPPGEYTIFFAMFNRSLKATGLDVYLNGDLFKQIIPSNFGQYYRDRGYGGYPEFYNSSLNSNYDRDGGTLGVVTVPEGETMPLELLIHWKQESESYVTFHHWCVRPTVDCY